MRSAPWSRLKVQLGVGCIVVSLAFLLLWFVGQEASSDPTLRAPRILELLYPGTWHPVARGLLWLFVGATGVGLDLLVAYPRTVTRRGRVAVVSIAVVTALSFTTFAIGTFAGADWSVIH